MIEWISVDELLPYLDERVLIWNGGVDVATFRKGITEEEREKMKRGELIDYEEEGWCATLGYTNFKRSSIRKPYDEWANNLVPYGWDVGTVVLNGQKVTHWAYFNTPEQYKEYRINQLTRESEMIRRTIEFDEMVNRQNFNDKVLWDIQKK